MNKNLPTKEEIQKKLQVYKRLKNENKERRKRFMNKDIELAIQDEIESKRKKQALEDHKAQMQE